MLCHSTIKEEAVFFMQGYMVHNHIMHLLKYCPHNLEKSATLWEPNKKLYNQILALIIELLNLTYYCISV